jgi:hypothetical protein
MVQDAFSLWLMNEHDLEEPPEVSGIIVAGLFPNPEVEGHRVFRSFTKGLTPWELMGMLRYLELTIENSAD